MSKDVRLINRDIMIGKMMAKGIRETSAKTRCLSDEEISAFIDGKLLRQERDAVIGHLSSCAECYALFSEALKTQQELEKRSRGRVKKTIYYALPVSLAAAALFFLVFTPLLRKTAEGPEVIALKPEEKPGPVAKESMNKLLSKGKAENEGTGESIVAKAYIPLSAAEMARTLSKSTADPTSLAKAIKGYERSEYGFSGGMSPEKAYFSIGVSLTDIEVAFMANDREKSLDSLKRVSVLLRLAGASETSLFYEEARKKIDGGAAARQFIGITEKAEHAVKDKKLHLLMSFGSWVEAGRLTSAAHISALPDAGAAHYFLENLKDKDLPAALTKALGEIEDIAGRGEHTDKDLKAVEKKFSLIEEIMP